VLAEITHAVFTRRGGVSPHPWHSLNLGHMVGDRPENVRQNFALACRALDVEPQQAVACHLVHGNAVLVVEADQANRLLGQADAMITQSPQVVLTMRYADCVPLLFYDRETRSIGLAHAGWRGTLQNMMGMVVRAMVERFASRPQTITVVIGPSIGPCCYQVGAEVYQAAGQMLTAPDEFFQRRDQGLYFDLWRTNFDQAVKAGLEQIIVSEICTACRTDDFFSHRAEQGRTGRFGVFLSLKPTDQA
jgi:YfiH family protein